MNERLRDALVGFFVIASLGALGTLMVMFGEMPDWVGAGDWELTITKVREIRGISDGTAVYLNGVEIGRVDRLEFKDPDRPGLGVQVVAKIRQRYSVPAGSVAKLYGAILGIGSGQVHIVVEPSPAMSPLPKEGAKIRGEMASAIGEVVTEDLTDSLQRTVDHIGNFAHAATPVAAHLADILEQRTIEDVDRPISPTKKLPANLATAIQRFDLVAANLNTLLGDKNAQEDLKGIVVDLKDSSEQVRKLVEIWLQETRRITDNVNEGIDRTEENLDNTFAKLLTLVGELGDSTKKLTNILSGISAGEGTAGLLARDERLYEAAVLAFERLADVLATIGRIVDKIDKEGRITIAQDTPVGTFTKDFPVGQKPGD